jgi:hypothetical protein
MDEAPTVVIWHGPPATRIYCRSRLSHPKARTVIMRKLLFLLSLIGAVGTLVPHAEAQISCRPHMVQKDVFKGYDVCMDGCKAEKTEKNKNGCHDFCAKVMDTCLKPAKEEERKLQEESSRQIHCRDPLIACLGPCMKETHNDQKKCGDRCDTSDVKSKYAACLKPRYP